MVDRHVDPIDTSSPVGVTRLLWQATQFSECVNSVRSRCGFEARDAAGCPSSARGATRKIDSIQAAQASGRSRRVAMGSRAGGYFQKSNSPPSNQSHST